MSKQNTTNRNQNPQQQENNLQPSKFLQIAIPFWYDLNSLIVLLQALQEDMERQKAAMKQRMLERRQRKMETEYEATSAALLVMQAEKRFENRRRQEEEGATKRKSLVSVACCWNEIKKLIALLHYIGWTNSVLNFSYAFAQGLCFSTRMVEDGDV